MRLQKGKWYVCVRHWGDDGWTKFREGDLLRCDSNDVMVDCYDIGHVFTEDDCPERIFREATEEERNIASATEVDMEDLMKDVGRFEGTDTLSDIYRAGAEAMLHCIRSQMNINGKEE